MALAAFHQTQGTQQKLNAELRAAPRDHLSTMHCFRRRCWQAARAWSCESRVLNSILGLEESLLMYLGMYTVLTPRQLLGYRMSLILT